MAWAFGEGEMQGTFLEADCLATWLCLGRSFCFQQMFWFAFA